MSEEKATKIIRLISYLQALGLTEGQIVGVLFIVF